MISQLDLLERVAILALHIRRLELDLVTGQNALEVRERLQKLRVQLDRSLRESDLDRLTLIRTVIM